jgi:hypothetical protein
MEGPLHPETVFPRHFDSRLIEHQGLDRRAPDEAALERDIVAWEPQRIAEQVPIDWRSSVTEARKTLERLYPSLPA